VTPHIHHNITIIVSLHPLFLLKPYRLYVSLAYITTFCTVHTRHVYPTLLPQAYASSGQQLFELSPRPSDSSPRRLSTVSYCSQHVTQVARPIDTFKTAAILKNHLQFIRTTFCATSPEVDTWRIYNPGLPSISPSLHCIFYGAIRYTPRIGSGSCPHPSHIIPTGTCHTRPAYLQTHGTS
jgi:hypothetical protein